MHEASSLFIAYISMLSNRTFCSHRNVLYLSCGGGYTVIYTCPNLPNCKAKCENFVLCKLHFSRLDLLKKKWEGDQNGDTGDS